jgi:dipeptidyl aminopeptidase/acylaminoacyl peptidase
VGIPIGRNFASFVPETRRPSVPERIALHAPGGMKITRLNLSPDGQSVAYSAGGSVFLQRLDGAEGIPLPGTDGAGTPFWSSDGRSLAFVARRALKRVGIGNSAPQVLGEINTNIGGAWSGDDILIGAIGDGLFRVRASGGPLIRLTTVAADKAEVRHLAPQFLPDQRHFLFVAASANPGESMLYAASLDSQERHPIMPVESNVAFVPAERNGFLVYVRGNVLMGQPFDPRTLTVSGNPFTIAAPVSSAMAVGTHVHLADFSATGDTLAYRSDRLPMDGPLRFEQTANVGHMNGQMTVIRNWMKQIRR